MKYIYAALLLHSSAKPVNEENMKQVLAAAGAEADEARIKALVASLAEVNIDEALKTALTVAPAPTAPEAAAPAEAKKKEEKPKEEKKEEEALAGLGALFG
ncbi:MAG: 50S ribosomal protein P1 [Candidatus Bathyarchaeia archaeon]